MRDKSCVRGGRMSCLDVMGDARFMSDTLLRREFRGPGDTIEAAAYRIEMRWGAPATLIKRLRHRNVTDMLISNYVKLKAAYEAACDYSEAQARHQEALSRAAGINEANSFLAKAATLVPGAPEGVE